MAKSSEYVVRSWKLGFFAPIAETEALSVVAQAAIRTELAKEVSWFISQPAEGRDIVITKRLTKQDALILASEDGDISNFDLFWSYRRQFWQWLLLS